MNMTQQLSAAEASRLAVTAAAADLEDGARSVAVHGQVDVHDLVGVLDVPRAAGAPQHWAPSACPTLAAG